MKNQILILMLFVLVSTGTINAQDNAKKSTINVLIDQVAAQTDKQIADRAAQIKMLQDLYKKFEETESDNLDRNLRESRRSANSREAMITADEMLRDPDNNARLAELAAYLRRAITRDEELFDQYVKQSETKRFAYELQLAKIKSQQTILRKVRKDLDRLRLFPTDKERTMFFLSTLQTVVNGLSALPSAAK